MLLLGKKRTRPPVPFISFALLAGVALAACALLPDREPPLPKEDVAWLEQMTRDVLEASRVRAGESVAGHGPNRTGCTLIRPGARDDYPAFWIRDYALSVDCGLISMNEQLPLLKLVAASQALGPQPKLLPSGSQVPGGSVPDHVTFAGTPIFFPGTVDDEAHQGGSTWGAIPLLDGGPFFVHLVHAYVVRSGDVAVLRSSVKGVEIVERLRAALAMAPRRPDGKLIRVDPDDRGINFGFDDAILHTGELLFASLLDFRARLELADLLERLGHAETAGNTELGAKAAD